MTKETTREQEFEVLIDAPIEDVWAAIAEGEGIAQWFVEQAELDEENKTYRLQWSADMVSEGTIDLFDRPHCLRLIAKPWSEQMTKLQHPLVEEYRLEPRDGRTLLRLVNSGIPASEDWDEFYDGTARGWPLFLAALKHFVEKHRGGRRTRVVCKPPVTQAFSEAWTTLVNALGFEKSPRAGESFKATLSAGGESLEVAGRVLLQNAPYSLSLNIANLGESLLWFDFEGKEGGSAYLYVDLSVFRSADADQRPLMEFIPKWAETLKL